MGYVRRGEFLGAEIGTIIADGVYWIRIEATPATTAFLSESGWIADLQSPSGDPANPSQSLRGLRPSGNAVRISPQADSGRAWFQIEYAEVIDRALIDLIDTLALIRMSKPNWGQMTFLDDGADG